MPGTWKRKTPTGWEESVGVLDHEHDADYVNEVDHDKATHDALGIDADTVDGTHASALLPRDGSRVMLSHLLPALGQETDQVSGQPIPDIDLGSITNRWRTAFFDFLRLRGAGLDQQIPNSSGGVELEYASSARFSLTSRSGMAVEEVLAIAGVGHMTPGTTDGVLDFGAPDARWRTGYFGTSLLVGGSEVWHAGNDGPGSGLDADTVDGQHASAFAGANGEVPIGGIILWSGSVASIPSNYALCDGASGTPDLRNRFVVGAGSSYGVGSTGGASSVTLTAAQMPSHAHDMGHHHSFGKRMSSSAGIADAMAGSVAGSAGSQNTSGPSSSTTGSAGSTSSHENRPPYYALAYIMRVS